MGLSSTSFSTLPFVRCSSDEELVSSSLLLLLFWLTADVECIGMAECVMSMYLKAHDDGLVAQAALQANAISKMRSKLAMLHNPK